uniref:Uncharacterized protein n=1 Tax=Arundo donax TaxID=35708 RepID=A0A0A9H4V6_ARUDO
MRLRVRHDAAVLPQQLHELGAVRGERSLLRRRRSRTAVHGR